MIMQPLHIGSRREVCWDEALMETAQGVAIKMHRPQYRGTRSSATSPGRGMSAVIFLLYRMEKSCGFTTGAQTTM